MKWNSLDAGLTRGYRTHRLAVGDIPAVERVVRDWWERQREECSGVMVLLDQSDPAHFYVSPEWPCAALGARAVPPDARVLTDRLAEEGLNRFRDMGDLRVYVPAEGERPDVSRPVYRTIWFTGPPSGAEALVERWLAEVYPDPGGPTGAWLVQGLDDLTRYAVSVEWASAADRSATWREEGPAALAGLLGAGAAVTEITDLQRGLWLDVTHPNPS